MRCPTTRYECICSPVVPVMYTVMQETFFPCGKCMSWATEACKRSHRPATHDPRTNAAYETAASFAARLCSSPLSVNTTTSVRQASGRRRRTIPGRLHGNTAGAAIDVRVARTR